MVRDTISRSPCTRTAYSSRSDTTSECSCIRPCIGTSLAARLPAACTHPPTCVRAGQPRARGGPGGAAGIGARSTPPCKQATPTNLSLPRGVPHSHHGPRRALPPWGPSAGRLSISAVSQGVVSISTGFRRLGFACVPPLAPPLRHAHSNFRLFLHPHPVHRPHQQGLQLDSKYYQCSECRA